jgi:hypothetical protein
MTEIWKNLAQLLSSTDVLDNLSQSSLGIHFPSNVKLHDEDDDYLDIEIGTQKFTKVLLLGYTNITRPLPKNITQIGKIIVLWQAGKKESPIAMLIEPPFWVNKPLEIGSWQGFCVVGDVPYWCYGKGLIPIAPFDHDHRAGYSTQQPDAAGNAQQNPSLKLANDTHWLDKNSKQHN